MDGSNETRHTQRAAAGRSHAVRADVLKPDTFIVTPDGKQLVL
jgi:hypothetical protein